jgi:hypothetical protein
MSAQQSLTAIPPIEAVSSELITSLAFAAHAYMEPIGDDAGVDLDAAEIAIDLAGKIFDRIQPRLPSSERSAFGRLLTELRMTYVRKRGA